MHGEINHMLRASFNSDSTSTEAFSLAEVFVTFRSSFNFRSAQAIMLSSTVPELISLITVTSLKTEVQKLRL